MNTGHIVKYLQECYTDERLAMLKAHAEDGKLGYGSCCCFVGIPTADHELQEAPGIMVLASNGVNIHHYIESVKGNLAKLAELEFKTLGKRDTERRENLLLLINVEIARRDELSKNVEIVESGIQTVSR